LGTLVGVSGLRPFRKYELDQLGGEKAFMPAAWASCKLPDAEQMWAVPLYMDTRHIYYRKDILQRAGIDEKTAFATPDALLDTLAHLQAQGAAIPIALPTNDNVLHAFSAWVWGAGGDFRSPDGRKIWLTDPNTLAGIVKYFRIHSYVATSAQNLNATETDELFRSGQAAIVISGGWLMHRLNNFAGVHADVLPNLGVAPLPGVPFVGGSNLVIWAHCVNEQETIQLIRHLTDPRTQANLFRISGNLPAARANYDQPPFTTNPNYQAIFESIRQGRTIEATNRWGVVEERLVEMARKLWKDLFNRPDLNLAVEVERRIVELANEVEQKLLVNW
jgi:multiple sugar transport system substrate-binding protein